MSASAFELIRAVEANGGQLRVDGGYLVIAPGRAAALVMEGLRERKPEIVALLQSRTEQETEPAPDSDALGLWMLARCVYRDRCWDGLGALHLNHARWCADCGRPVPASRRAFVAAIQAQGFEVTADGFVYGLILAEDWEAHERYQAAPVGSGQPSRERLDAQPYPYPFAMPTGPPRAPGTMPAYEPATPGSSLQPELQNQWAQKWTR
jgi:hypothetical protein